MRSIRSFALLMSMFMCCAPLAAAPDAALVAPQDLILAIRAKDDEATKAAAARLQAAAEAGDSFAMYDIGSLHRQSGRKGAAVFAYDPGKALKWLTRAFDGGRLTAAYKIALTYAAIGDDMEAMGWAQVYSHFMRPIEQRQDRQSPLRLVLLNDLYARIGSDREDAIEARLMTLLDKHGPPFEAARERAPRRHPDWIADEDECEVTVPPGGAQAAVRIPGNGLVEYLVAIDARGRPTKSAALDATPQPMLERDLRPLVQRIDCRAQGRTRYLFQNFQLESGARLRLDGD